MRPLPWLWLNPTIFFYFNLWFESFDHQLYMKSKCIHQKKKGSWSLSFFCFLYFFRWFVGKKRSVWSDPIIIIIKLSMILKVELFSFSQSSFKWFFMFYFFSQVICLCFLLILLIIFQINLFSWVFFSNKQYIMIIVMIVMTVLKENQNFYHLSVWQTKKFPLDKLYWFEK